MKDHNLFQFLLHLGDDSLILGHRLSEWCGHGPILEEDIALTNISLDLIGQTTSIFQYAAEIQGEGKTEDDLAFLRYEREYTNLLLVEQANGDFGMTIMRQFLFDAFRKPLYEALTKSTDTQLSAIAEKSLKETKYHLKHSAEWVIRLGDGTEESHCRIQDALDTLWVFTDEMFVMEDMEIELVSRGVVPDLSTLKPEWQSTVDQVLAEATLTIPTNGWQRKGGRAGLHTEHLGYILAELQYMQRAYPGMKW